MAHNFSKSGIIGPFIYFAFPIPEWRNEYFSNINTGQHSSTGQWPKRRHLTANNPSCHNNPGVLTSQWKHEYFSNINTHPHTPWALGTQMRQDFSSFPSKYKNLYLSCTRKSNFKKPNCSGQSRKHNRMHKHMTKWSLQSDGCTK